MKGKVLFMLHLPPPVHGSSMVGKWIKDSKLIDSSFKCSFINLLASKEVKQSGKVSLGKLVGMLRIVVELISQLIRNRPRLCYIALTTTGIGFYRDVFLVFILKLFKVKRVYHLHNKGVSKAALHKFNAVLYKFVFKNARVILLSEYLYFDIQQFVSKSDVDICFNGVPYIENHEKQAQNNVPVILFLSNLIESKGVYILLKAMAILKSKGVEFKGNFVGGEGDWKSETFKEIVGDLGLTDNVAYLGKKFNQEKEHVFKQADIFAFPTFYAKECFPLVLLEAMSYGLPIITTNEGGIESIVNDDVGFIVSKNDVKELAEKLEKLINLPSLRREMGIKSRERFVEYFTLDKFEQNLLKLLDKSI
ncbi:glycosyltransferase [Wenyingzhuangia sp. IMCC45574]